MAWGAWCGKADFTVIARSDSDEAIQLASQWIASLALAMTGKTRLLAAGTRRC